MGKIRLACMFCDRDDFDGVDNIPTNWFSVDESQTCDALLQEAGIVEATSSWYTHLGVCPDCQQSELGLVPTKAVPM